MNKEMILNLVAAWAKAMKKDLPKMTFESESEYFYTFKVDGTEDEVTFGIKEHDDFYEVGVYPVYDILVRATESTLCLLDEEIDDFEGAIDSVYEEISSHGYCQWVKSIPMNPPHIRPSDDTIIDDAIDKWLFNHKGNMSIDDLVRWYIACIYLPAFMDQTKKHMVKEVESGIPEFIIEDVVQYWAQQMENGESMECMLDEVDTYYNNL